MASVSETQFLKLASDYGQRYLSSGGPTSRLESDLAIMGESLGQSTEVFATPTGLFISSRKEGPPVTTLARIKDSSIDLAEVIRLETLSKGVVSKRLTVGEAIADVHKPKAPLSTLVLLSATLIGGFAASFSQYYLIFPAILSGLVMFLTSWLTGPLSQRLGFSGIYTDFFVTVLALLLSGIFAFILEVPAESIAIGTIVLLVPGLTLTNAISELTEQNFVSGTAKLMKGVLTLLALGTAYLLVVEIMKATNLGTHFSGTHHPQTNIPYPVKLIGIAVIIGAFSMLFRIPAKLLPFALITGCVSWIVLQPFQSSGNFVLGSFLPALSVGLLSLIFGKLMTVPSQIFSVPGIFSLVPGLLALSSFRSLSGGAGQAIPEISFQVAIVCSSITFGLLTARIPFLIVRSKDFDT